MKFNTLFDRKKVKGVDASQGKGAQQHFKNDCDLNKIIKRYPDGVPPPTRRPIYGDFTAIGMGLERHVDAWQFVSDWFDSLPADLRARFANDPLKAQHFVLANPPEVSVKLGLIAGEAPAAPQRGTGGSGSAAVAVPPKSAPAPENVPTVPSGAPGEVPKGAA